MNNSRKHYVLYDVEGNLVFKGDAHSHGSFLKQYIGQKKPEDKKDLRGLNLRNFDFTGFGDVKKYNFSGSDLSGAVFANINMEDSLFKNCKFENTSFLKVDANNCNFDFSHFENGNMNFSSFMRSSFFGCDITEVDASRSNFENSDFSETNILHSDFEKSKMMATNFINAHVKLTSFKGVNLEDTPNHAFAKDKERMKIYRDIEGLLPDRTIGASFSDCDYTDTKLSPNMIAAKWDKHLGNYAGNVISLLTVAGTAYGIEKFVESGKEYAAKTIEEHANISSFLGHLISNHPTFSGVAFIAGIGLFTFGKEKTVDLFKDTSSDILKKIFKTCRNVSHSLIQTGYDIGNVAVTIANPRGSREIEKALQAHSNTAQKLGWMSVVKYSLKSLFGLNKDMGDIIICDKSHLGLALETISKAREGKYSKNKDVTLVLENLCDPVNDNGCSPSTLILNQDGGIKAVWSSKVAPYDVLGTISYSNDGSIQMAYDANNQPLDKDAIIELGALTKTSVLEQFEKSILQHPELKKKDFSYNPETSRIIAGRNGSIFVESKASGMIDNGDKFAIISPFINTFAINGKLESKNKAETLQSRRNKRKTKSTVIQHGTDGP